MSDSESIPKVQKAVKVLQSGTDFKVTVVDDYPVPVPQSGEILVRLTYSGVCHSDLSSITKDIGFNTIATINGHEGSGYIVQHGPGVEDKVYPKGTRVGVPLNSNACHNCENCEHDESYCQNQPMYGFAIDGTWQQYVIVKARYVIPLPPNVDAATVGPILCGGVTVYKALKKANVKGGQWVAFTGAGGGLGSFGIQYARALGLRVVAIDTGGEKEALCKELGAEVFVDFAKDNVVEKINKVTGGGVHTSVMLAPVVKVYAEAIAYTRSHGTIVYVGLVKAGQTVDVSPTAAIFKGLHIVGSLVGNRTDIKEALDFADRGLVKPAVKVHPIDDIQEILTQMHKGQLTGRAVVDLR